MKPADVGTKSSDGTKKSPDVRAQPADANAKPASARSAGPLVSPQPRSKAGRFGAFLHGLFPVAGGRACPICAQRTERVHTPWYYRPLRWIARGSGTRYCYRCRKTWFALGGGPRRDTEATAMLKVRPVRSFATRRSRPAPPEVRVGLGQPPAKVTGAPATHGKKPEKQLDAVRLLTVLIDALAELEAELTGSKRLPNAKSKDPEDRSIMH